MTDRNSRIPRLRALVHRFDEQQRQGFFEELRQFLDEEPLGRSKLASLREARRKLKWMLPPKRTLILVHSS